MGEGLRIGVVDDHIATAAGVPVGLKERLVPAPVTAQAETVADLERQGGSFDVVLLDVRLQDGSTVAGNVRRLVELGWPVILYTSERRSAVHMTSLEAGALGIVDKNEGWDVLIDAVQTAARGEPFLNAEWAEAMRALTTNTVPSLSPREVEVLRAYASGMPMKSVARMLDIVEVTGWDHLKRVKRKYEEAGRPTGSRYDLYVRAVEDDHLPPPLP